METGKKRKGIVKIKKREKIFKENVKKNEKGKLSRDKYIKKKRLQDTI